MNPRELVRNERLDAVERELERLRGWVFRLAVTCLVLLVLVLLAWAS